MSDLLAKVESLQNLLVDMATGSGGDDQTYQDLRKEIVNNPTLKDCAPDYLRRYRTLGQFWQYIKNEFSHYSERRTFIWDSFHPLLEKLESTLPSPLDQDVTQALRKFDSDAIQSIWTKALERRESDAEGAITIARTLLEGVCKHILDENGVSYDSNSDLPILYKNVAETLKVAPSQHSEQIFKQILGGCSAVVGGLGALRNRLSDAHGQGKKPVRPAPRHAELAVNLAGAVAMFLVSTYKAHAEKTKG